MKSLNRHPFIAFLSLCVIATAMMLVPGAAFAQSAFTVVTDDYFINVLLRGVLGPVINVNGASAGSTITAPGTLGEIFRVFNLGVAFFGSLIVVFITVVGVLQSGQDGEFLGRRWSSMWVPIRFAAGSALMLPLTNSGYSFCQAMVLWVASQGVGFADTLWNTIVDRVVVKNGVAITGEMKVQDVLRNMALSEICVASVNRNAGTTDFGFQSAALQNPQTRITTINMAWGKSVPMASSDPTTLRGACGSMSYSYLATGGVNDDPYIGIRQRVGEEHLAIIQSMQPMYRQTAEQLVEALDSNTAGASAEPDFLLDQMGRMIETHTQFYTDRMAARIQTEIASSTLGPNQANNAAHMKRYGFVTAGVWYMELTKVHNAVRQGLKAPEYHPIDAQMLDGSTSWPKTRHAIDVTSANLQSRFSTGSAGDVTSSVSTNASGTVATRAVDFKLNPSDFIQPGMMSKVFASISLWLTELTFGVGTSATGNNSVFAAFSAPSQNPNTSAILQLKDKGDTILDIAGLLFTSHIASIVTTGAADGGGIPGAIAKATGALFGARIVVELGGYFVAMGTALFILGVTLSVFIPMVPYILWVGAIVGMVILIIEALIAIMLWAVMLMHPSGEGLTSEYNRQGTMVLLAVFMRPSLMLMGYVTGMFMVEPLIAFVNDSFGIALKSVQANTITGLISIFAFIGIYVSLVLMIVDKCFAMIHVVPDRVLQWIGGPGALTGEERDAQHRGEAMIRAGAQGLQTAVMGRMRGPQGMHRGRIPTPKWRD